MDLSELLDYHSVMGIFKGDKTPTGTETYLYTTDVPTLLDAPHDGYFCIPFSIDSKPVIPNTYWLPLRVEFDMAQDMYFHLTAIAASQTSSDLSHVKFKLDVYSSTSGWDSSSEVNLEIGQTYIVVFKFLELGVLLECYLYSVSPEGLITYITGTKCEAYVSSSPNQMSSITVLNSYTSSYGAEAIYRLYELAWMGVISSEAVDVSFKHMTFGEERTTTFTYYAPSMLLKNYLMPPYNAFNGSIYDQSEILNAMIEDLEDELDDANTALATANSALATANASINTTNSRLTSTRGGFLDNLNNPQLINLPNLSTFTPTKIATLSDILVNAANLAALPDLSGITSTIISTLPNLDYITENASLLPDLSGITPSIISKLPFLDNINNTNLLGFTASHLSGLGTMKSIYDTITANIGEYDILDFIKGLINTFTPLWAKTLNRVADKKFFDIQLDTSVGVKLDLFETLENMINSINTAVNDWITDNDDLLDEAHINALSGIGLPFEVDVNILPAITFPRIKSMTVFGFDYDFPTATWNILEIILQCFRIALPDWIIPTFTDIDIPNSSNAWFDRNSQWKRGSEFDPPETYKVFRDFLGKDLPSSFLIIKLIGLFKKVLGNSSLSTEVAKAAFNSVNVGNINEVVKTMNNTASLISSIGNHDDPADGTSTFSKLLKNYNHLASILGISNADTLDIDEIEDMVSAIKAKFDSAYSPQKGKLIL